MLSHYSKHPVEKFAHPSPPLDNEHKPGGLWLSDDSEYGWPAFIRTQLENGNNEWADGSELLQYPYHFIIDPRQSDQILVLKTPDDLRQFTSDYREASPRECIVNGKPGYGVHIEWGRVKSDYKGILITPYQEELSHRKGDPEFHWYRFDCASGCCWDVTCLIRL